MNKSVSDRYLMSLWRQAVLKKNNGKCIFCNEGNPANLECHHFIKRRIKVLRWDWKNGFPVCRNHHHIVHTKAGERELIKAMGPERYDYLCAWELVLYNAYLIENGMNDNEFRLEVKKELKNIINS